RFIRESRCFTMEQGPRFNRLLFHFGTTRFIRESRCFTMEQGPPFNRLLFHFGTTRFICESWCAEVKQTDLRYRAHCQGREWRFAEGALNFVKSRLKARKYFAHMNWGQGLMVSGSLSEFKQFLPEHRLNT
ncbi:hypothetical protein, partial [Paenibacillus alkalitolerans]|uniref:hypothetical protein n=1 Tax=Paenibacillus alkalitolerans TaxID=2799335 RepID=UPI0018F63DD0